MHMKILSLSENQLGWGSTKSEVVRSIPPAVVRGKIIEKIWKQRKGNFGCLYLKI